MLIGYAKALHSEPADALERQCKALSNAGVDEQRIFTDLVHNTSCERPGLLACIKSLRPGDILVVYRLEYVGRSLLHLVETVWTISKQEVGLRILTGLGKLRDSAATDGEILYPLFETLAKHHRQYLSERTKAGLDAARKRGRRGGRKFLLSTDQLRYAQRAVKSPQINIDELCEELSISKSTLYRYMDTKGKLRRAGYSLIRQTKSSVEEKNSEESVTAMSNKKQKKDRA